MQAQSQIHSYDRSFAARFGALAFTANISVFLTQFIAQFGAQGYNPATDDISLLGVTRCGALTDPMTQATIIACSPLHTVFNAGLVFMGVSVLIGALLTRRNWPGKMGAAGVGLLSIAAAGTVLSGLAPINEKVSLHLLGAMIYFPLIGIAIALLGLSVRKTEKMFSHFSLACGVICFIGFFVYGNYLALDLPRGIMERVAAYPSTLWVVACGVFLLARRRRVFETAAHSAG